LTNLIEEQLSAPNGAFYLTRLDELQLPVRLIEWSDNGEPAGNFVHCDNLLRLYRLSGDQSYKEAAQAILKAGQPLLDEVGVTACSGLTALQRLLSRKSVLIAIALGPDAQDRVLFEGILGREFLPHISKVWITPEDQELIKLLPQLATLKPVEGKTAIYIQKEGEWESPIIEADALRERLHTL
jgi:uncharacterized protein YyaL (SSP411 family)